jgi:predicted MFS family arabinose efflux permease
MTLLALVGIFGVASGLAFVAISVGLTASSAPAVRGLVMGGYSTSLYLGFAVGSFALGPVITHYGYAAGFALGAAGGVVGALVAGLLWTRNGTRCLEPSNT